MAHRIDTVEGRSKLKPRSPTYWQKLSNGCHLGFRKLTASSSGSWMAQAYDPETKKQTRRTLGGLENITPNLQFNAAKKAAEAWFDHLGKGGNIETATIKEACQQYVKHVRRKKGDTQADDIEARFSRWVYETKFANIELPKLTRKHVESWRRTLEDTPVIANPHREKAKQVTRKRSPSSVNRDMTSLRASLNHAYDNAQVTSDLAWRVALRPIENADSSRDAYLDRQQRQALIDKAQPDVALFLRALAIVPLRPGALAALTVASFDKRLGVLTIGKDKAGRDRKIKLPESTASFFAERAKGKLPAAPLMARADGKAWDKDAWKRPVRAAATAAGLPVSVTAYALRHSSITDLVTGGLDLLTVAQLSGTSVAMIERHYGHLRADHAAAALAALAL
jgi:site-specific recombinase XerD